MSEPSKRIQINLLDGLGRRLKMSAKTEITFRRVLERYCQHSGHQLSSLALEYQGRAVAPDDTLICLGVKNRDVMNVRTIVEQSPQELIKKDDKENADNFVDIVLLDQNSQKYRLRVQTDVPFSDIITKYCNQFNYHNTWLRFYYDGTRIRPIDTPRALQMQSGDSVDVFAQQDGG